MWIIKRIQHSKYNTGEYSWRFKETWHYWKSSRGSGSHLWSQNQKGRGSGSHHESTLGYVLHDESWMNRVSWERV